MILPNILSVGYEPHLLETRSMIMRQAGYEVHATSVLATALSQIESDVIDGIVLCNSIPRKQQEWFVTQVMNIRRLMPILCIRSTPYEQCIPGCTGIDGEPELLLAALSQTVGLQWAIDVNRFKLA